MSIINIAKNIRQYSADELRDYGYRGLLDCNGFDLTDFIELIFTDYKGQSEVETDQEEVAEARKEGYDEGWADAKHEAIAAVENI